MTKPDVFALFLVLVLQVGFCAIGLGMAIASIAPAPEAAQGVGPIIVVLMILLSGFYINVESIPAAIRWVQYLSIMRWEFAGLAVNEFTGVKFSCSDVSDGATCIRTGE